jgi:hypothetical protein
MEDYQGAADARLSDVDALLSAASVRCVAASHLGGAAVECRLKALVARYHRISEWGGKSSRAKDRRNNQPIPNPGHSLSTAIRSMSDVYDRAKLDKDFLQHLGRVMHPAGATMTDFIALRYRGAQLPAATLTDWKISFKYVVGWLKKNEVII